MADLIAARERVLHGLKHMRIGAENAIEEAGEGGIAQLGILALKAGGTQGRITCRFNAIEFFEDLALILGIPPLTEDDRLDCATDGIVDWIHRNGGTIRNDPFGPQS